MCCVVWHLVCKALLVHGGQVLFRLNSSPYMPSSVPQHTTHTCSLSSLKGTQHDTSEQATGHAATSAAMRLAPVTTGAYPLRHA